MKDELAIEIKDEDILKVDEVTETEEFICGKEVEENE